MPPVRTNHRLAEAAHEPTAARRRLIRSGVYRGDNEAVKRGGGRAGGGQRLGSAKRTGASQGRVLNGVNHETRARAHREPRSSDTLLTMRWSKVRKLVEESFADSVRGRVTIHVTNADPRGTSRQETCKRSWIRIDGETVADLDRHANVLTLRTPGAGGSRIERRGLVHPFTRESRNPSETDKILDLTQAAWAYHQSNVSAALSSPDPFVQSLAILSSRVGRQRLRRLEQMALHPLPRLVLRFRLKAERDRAAETGRIDSEPA